MIRSYYYCCCITGPVISSHCVYLCVQIWQICQLHEIGPLVFTNVVPSIKGAWIITGGTHAGVMKYVGEAVRDYALLGTAAGQGNVVAIGFASWGAIDQRDELIDERVTILTSSQ